MQLVNTNIKTMAYVESEAEFNRAKVKGFWEVLLSRITGRKSCLWSLGEVMSSVDKKQTSQTVDLGLSDVPIEKIIGSVSRNQDFTRHFLPCSGNRSGKERWRGIYTLAVTGMGFPPVALYKVGDDYFVEDGHHRISVAKYLGWETIQAHVVALIPASQGRPSCKGQFTLCKGVA